MDEKKLAKFEEDYELRGQAAIDDLRENDPVLFMQLLGDVLDEDEALVDVEEKPKPKFEVACREGESEEQALARISLRPEYLATMSVNALTGGAGDSLNELAAELEAQNKAISEGGIERAESMLSSQAHTLDAMFHALTRRGVANIEGGYSEIGREYLKLALRAQSQGRSTVDSLVGLSRPVIKQTNIANGHQQVNNFAGENPPNELLEQQREWLDRRKAKEAIGDDSPVEAVGKIDGAEVA